MSHQNKTVGELNGVNALLFRVNMILIPIMSAAILGWGAWTTKTVQRNGDWIDRHDAERDLYAASVKGELRVENSEKLRSIEDKINLMSIRLAELSLEIRRQEVTR